MPETPNLWHIFEKRIIQGYHKWYSYMYNSSNMINAESAQFTRSSLNILVELWWHSFKEMSMILFYNDVTTDWRHTYKVTNAQRSFLIRWFYTTRCLNCGTNFATKQKNHILWCGVKFCGVEWCFCTYKSTLSKYTHSLVDYTEWFRKCMYNLYFWLTLMHETNMI